MMNHERESNRERRRHRYGRAYPGVILIVLGTLFLLENLGYIRAEMWPKLWPLLLIIPGVSMLLNPRKYGR